MLQGFISSSKKVKFQQGFTLLEVMIAGAVSVVVVGTLMVMTVFVSKTFKATTNYIDLDRTSRITLDTMNRDIRNAASLSMTTYLTNNITMTNSDGSSFSYQWTPSNSTAFSTTLMRYYTNADGTHTSTVMLTNCDTLSFYLYQRSPTNDLQFISTTNNLSQTKLINVDWKCSRQIMGVKKNTESVQTAQITIRN